MLLATTRRILERCRTTNSLSRIRGRGAATTAPHGQVHHRCGPPSALGLVRPRSTLSSFGPRYSLQKPPPSQLVHKRAYARRSGDRQGASPEQIILLLRIVGRVAGSVIRYIRQRGLHKSYPRLIAAILLIPTTIGGLYMASHVRACPFTGRLQLILMDKETEQELGATAASQVLKQESDFILPPNSPETLLVHDVAANLIRQVDELHRKDMEWEVCVIESDVINAFVVPGGKIFVYTALLEQVETTGALAFILGHEISHALASHGVEKMGVWALGALFTEMIGGAFGPSGHQYLQHLLLPVIQSFIVDRPYSRGLESEADSLGLIIMSKAGYDPREAVESWKRMEAAEQGKGGKMPMELLSTHPSHGIRIARLTKELPAALVLQKQALEEKRKSGEPIPDSYKRIPVVTKVARRSGKVVSVLGQRRAQSAVLAAKASSLVVGFDVDE